jgi:hypothetical protein
MEESGPLKTGIHGLRETEMIGIVHNGRTWVTLCAKLPHLSEFEVA